jgi:uncharacterized membrane protein
MIGRIVAHVRGRIGGGLLIVLPLLITIWLLGILFDVIDTRVTPWVLAALRAAGTPGLDQWPARFAVPLIGVLLTAGLIYFAGLLTGNLLGRRLLAMFESAMLRIPLVKGIYGAARQLLDAVSLTGKRPFSRVVLVEFPKAGTWTVGFVTQERTHSIGGPQGGEPAVSVFVPTAPNPTSGWVLFVPATALVDLDLSIEQGLKLIVSGGIVSPPDLGALRARRNLPATAAEGRG